MPYKDQVEQVRYRKEWIKKRRELWLQENGPCRLCGSSERLEVDHIDPLTKVSHRIWSWNKEKREAELVKCQPLCYKCHKKKTAESLWRPITHGTAGGYDRGCKCEECSKWQKDRMDRYHTEHPRGKAATAG